MSTPAPSLTADPSVDERSAATPVPLDALAAEVEAFFDWVHRNPVIKTHDLTGGEHGVAKTFTAHVAAVTDLVRGRYQAGDLVAVVQRAKRGFWVTEWTVAGHGDMTHATRRRAAFDTDLSMACEQFKTLLSFHSSHYFRPEDGLLGWWDRL